MKILNRGSVIVFVATIIFGLAGPIPTRAASSPELGQAASFGILSSTYTNTVGGTTINGDVGYTTGPATAPTVNGSTFSPPATKYSGAGTDQAAALADLNSQLPCDFSYAPGAINLATNVTTPDGVGQFSPGIYCISGAASIGGAGTITLTGTGTYIFRITGALTTSANSTVVLTGGASACDVFWTPGGATTLGANSTFVGTDIDASGITIGSTVTWTGRALAFGGTISTDVDTITAPTCSSPEDEEEDEGDDEAEEEGDNDSENDKDQDIEVTKKATPTALSGFGSVTYTYAVKNEGDDSIRNVSVKDDKCSPLKFISGDIDRDSRLDTDETWKYTCTKMLSATETNTVTAKGTANGEDVKDTDTAKVTVTPGLPHAGVGPQQRSGNAWNTLFQRVLSTPLFLP
ncbi:MAG: ice-binding family protein [Candidatus Moraniibacteriota bacterium]